MRSIGAGKTTTLALLTGDIQPTSGDAFVAGLPLSDPNTRKYIGFCPQVDPLLGEFCIHNEYVLY
jgi:ABC-type multidrug transport system ATPase subunit